MNPTLRCSWRRRRKSASVAWNSEWGWLEWQPRHSRPVYRGICMPQSRTGPCWTLKQWATMMMRVRSFQDSGQVSAFARLYSSVTRVSADERCGVGLQTPSSIDRHRIVKSNDQNNRKIWEASLLRRFVFAERNFELYYKKTSRRSYTLYLQRLLNVIWNSNRTKILLN